MNSQGLDTPHPVEMIPSQDVSDQGMGTPHSVEPTSSEGDTTDPETDEGMTFSIGNATVAEMPVDKNAQFYSMNNKRRGKALIFNHKKFDNPKTEDRVGTHMDRRNLVTMFSELGFEVHAYNDLKYKGINEKINQAIEEDHSDCDCFAMAVLTHGEEADMLWAKDAPYNSKILWENFTADKCPTLAGKPKIFFIQACRGKKLDPGIKLTSSEADSDSNAYCIPVECDFLIAYSTVPGYFSWRNEVAGSWFVQALCKEMEKANYSHLFEVLTTVNRHVAVEFQSSCKEKYKDAKKQAPCVYSTLTRLLQLTPKNK